MKKSRENATNQSTEVSLNWEYLLKKFVKINAIKYQSEQEYELLALARQYEIPLESLEKIFVLYQEQVEMNNLESNKHLPGSLLVKLEYFLDKLHHRLKMMAIFPILEQLAKLSLIIGLTVFVTECTSRGDERIAHQLRTEYEAWKIIKTHRVLENIEDSSNGGRKEAVEYLSQQGLDLSGINLSNTYLTGIKLNSNHEIIHKILKIFNIKEDPRFLRINLENTVIFKGDLSNINLVFSNFKQAMLWRVKFNNSNLARTNFEGADLENSTLINADLRCTNFLGVEYLTIEQVKSAKEESWKLAIYNPKFAKKKLNLGKTRNMLDVLNGDYYDNDIIDKDKDLKGLNFYCYGFHIDSIYNEKQKKQELKKIHKQFYVFKESVEKNFKNADFQYAYLKYLDLTEVNLENADLSNAYFNKTILIGSNLRGANLFKAKKLSKDQIKLSCNWDQAIYTEANWDNEELKWIPKDKKANQKKIKSIENYYSYDSQELPDCDKWK